MKAKHLLAIKLFLTLIFMTIFLYKSFGIGGAVLGICGTLMIINMLDKDFSNCMIKEYFIILFTQLFVVVLSKVASINYISLGISTILLSLIINKVFICYQKSPRTIGFLLLYLIIIYTGVKGEPISYPKTIIGCIVSSILIMFIYYFLTRKMYFIKKDKKVVSINKFDLDEFNKFKFRFNILSTIIYTLAIFPMKYLYTYHGLWIETTLLVVLLPDRKLSIKKIFNRIIGTITGTIIYIVLVFLIKGNIIVILSLTLVSTYLLVYPMKHYSIQAIFVTFFALSIDSIVYKQTDIFLGEYRILFTIIGALLALCLFAIEKKIIYISNNKV